MGIIIFFLERYTAVEIKLNVKVTYEMNYEMNTCKNMAYFFFEGSVFNTKYNYRTCSNFFQRIILKLSCHNKNILFLYFFYFYSLYWRQRYHGFT